MRRINGISFGFYANRGCANGRMKWERFGVGGRNVCTMLEGLVESGPYSVLLPNCYDACNQCGWQDPHDTMPRIYSWTRGGGNVDVDVQRAREQAREPRELSLCWGLNTQRARVDIVLDR